MLRRLFRAPYKSPEEQAYARLAEKGFQPRSIIDVGAYEGNWTRMAKRLFPASPVLMVEAQASKVPLLQRVCAEHQDVTLVSAVLAATEGQAVTFYEMETGSSLLPEQSDVERIEAHLSSRTLDGIAADLDGPLFLKIDVQGAELEVLAGGARTLDRCEAVQLEIAVLPYNRGAPTFLEVIQFMDERDFVPYDLAGWSRPNGVDLVQIDLLFVRRNSPMRPSFFHFG